MALLKKDVRSAHFQFGNSETNYLSNNARTMVQHQIPRDSGNHRKEAKEKMQTANFCLEAKPDSSPVKTTNDHYLGAADDKEAWENCRATVQPRQHKSNVVITNNDKLQTTTEHNYQFMNPSSASTATNAVASENKHMESYLKAHHFRIGSSTTLNYDTTN